MELWQKKRSPGYAVINFLTAAWNAGEEHNIPQCFELHSIINGTALLSRENVQTRLADNRLQLDFILGPPARLCGREGVYPVMQDEHMFVTVRVLPLKGHWSNRTIWWETATAHTQEVGARSYMYKLHFQWAADLFAAQLNTVADHVAALDCQSENARMERALLLSQQSPVWQRRVWIWKSAITYAVSAQQHF